MPEAAHPEPTEFEKFLAFTKRVVSVPKAEIDRREAEYKKQRKAEKKARERAS